MDSIPRNPVGPPCLLCTPKPRRPWDSFALVRQVDSGFKSTRYISTKASSTRALVAARTGKTVIPANTSDLGCPRGRFRPATRTDGGWSRQLGTAGQEVGNVGL